MPGMYWANKAEMWCCFTDSTARFLSHRGRDNVGLSNKWTSLSSDFISLSHNDIVFLCRDLKWNSANRTFLKEATTSLRTFMQKRRVGRFLHWRVLIWACNRVGDREQTLVCSPGIPAPALKCLRYKLPKQPQRLTKKTLESGGTPSCWGRLVWRFGKLWKTLWVDLEPSLGGPDVEGEEVKNRKGMFNIQKRRRLCTLSLRLLPVKQVGVLATSSILDIIIKSQSEGTFSLEGHAYQRFFTQALYSPAF